MIEPYSSRWEPWLNKWFLPLLIPALLINAGGLLIHIMAPDGALYAGIAKNIALSGDWVNLRVEGKDWLDKPHFPFWMAALSMRIFGINDFAYKLPAVLFWALGAFYTYRMAFALYGKQVGRLSLLIYVSAAQLVISNNDVRAEPYLTGLVIAAVYHFYKASRLRPGLHLLAGAFFAACAAMTKGPFVLVTIAAGFLVDWIAGKEWAQFRNPRWWLALLVTGLFLTPELYCLYQQFDLHPEKLVFGRHGVSGIRWFFWDSQFGRFLNTGPIKGNGDPFFFFHTLLWVFLPWSLLLYAAAANRLSAIRRSSYGDWICIGAAVISFAMFSLSRFQLPYYLNLLFPFFSIVTGKYLYEPHRRKTTLVIAWIQQFISFALPILLLLLIWFYHFNGWPFIVALILGWTILVMMLFRTRDLPAAIARSYSVALLVYLFINFILYPAILQYQAGTMAGLFVGNPNGRPAAPEDPSTTILQAPVFLLQEGPADYSFEFYSPRPVRYISIDDLPAAAAQYTHNDLLFYLPGSLLDSLSKRGYKTRIVKSFPDFHVSQLTGDFVYYKTRASATKPFVLATVSSTPANATPQ